MSGSTRPLLESASVRLPGALWPLALFLGTLAVALGPAGRATAARGEARNPGQALVGVVCGAAGAVLALLLAFIA
ncbi:hypothetical protein [Streptomyces sp. NPDC006971]|uniref:hypothetical protein n=1 Tax=Streptomyces sp. NPDC006971 TaxID=3154784 RepID=UPI0033E7F763